MARESNEPVGAVSTRSHKWIALLAVTASTMLHAQSGPAIRQADTQAVTEVGRYRLQINPWVNLDQRLLHEARFGTAPPAALSGEDLAKWKKIVESYRAFLGKRNPIFDAELVRMNAALSATSTPELPDSIPEAATAALEAAMPFYRAVQWEEDDRANRFWIAVAEPMLAWLPKSWPTRTQSVCDAVPEAYPRRRLSLCLGVRCLHGRRGGVCPRGHLEHGPGKSGLRGARVADARTLACHRGRDFGRNRCRLARAARELGVKPMSNLWHAILFYTSGELTRRALAKRGVHDYHPVISYLYEGPFRGYRQPLETHWQAYLDGKVSREAAIREILIETAPGKKRE